jgi:hypothetical protein
LIRSANLFLEDGLNFMMADTEPANVGIDLTFRLSSAQMQIQGFINAAINLWGKPVWVVGTSNGSVSAVTAAASSLSGLAGVVLTSARTDLSADPTNQTTFNMYVSQITGPAFVVWHKDDHCTVSSPAGSQALFTTIPSHNKGSAAFQGGYSVATDPCGAFSEHGYAGIEDEVVKKRSKTSSNKSGCPIPITGG